MQHCDRVRRDFQAVFPDLPSVDLVAEYPRVWAKQIHFKFRSGNSFEAFPLVLFPDGYGKNTTAFAQRVDAVYAAQFVVENGTVKGLALAETFDELDESADVVDAADVYFEKIN